MAEHWLFLNRLRQDLGKGYTTAHEHAIDAHGVHILVLRRKCDEVLTVAADPRWLALFDREQTLAPATRVEYKHLVVMIENFFAKPDNLPSQSFQWPGTQEHREELRRTLSPRRRRVASD